MRVWDGEHVISVRIKINIRQPDPQGRVESGEMEEAMKKLKVGKAHGGDGIMEDILK